MISEELRKYVDMVLQEEKNDNIHDIAVLGKQCHGIDNIIIYIGKSNNSLIVRFSSLKNNIFKKKKFVLRIPHLDYDILDVKKYISNHSMDKIIRWIKLNNLLLQNYEQNENMSSSEFLSMIRLNNE